MVATTGPLRCSRPFSCNTAINNGATWSCCGPAFTLLQVEGKAPSAQHMHLTELSKSSMCAVMSQKCYMKGQDLQALRVSGDLAGTAATADRHHEPAHRQWRARNAGVRRHCAVAYAIHRLLAAPARVAPARLPVSFPSTQKSFWADIVESCMPDAPVPTSPLPAAG